MGVFRGADSSTACTTVDINHSSRDLSVWGSYEATVAAAELIAVLIELIQR
jgi:hypothetical protein